MKGLSLLFLMLTIAAQPFLAAAGLQQQTDQPPRQERPDPSVLGQDPSTSIRQRIL